MNTNRFLEVQLRSVLVECERETPEEGVKSERYILACQKVRESVSSDVADKIIGNVELNF